MKTKDLLNEWKIFLNESATIPLKIIKSKIESSRSLNETEKDRIFQNLQRNWNKIFKKFSNVINNDLSNTQEPVSHMLEAIESFSIYYNTVTDEMKQRIISGNITTSELRGYVESKNEAKKSENRTNNRVKCRSAANLTSGKRWNENATDDVKDFEVIYVDSDWTVVYPKTLLGSISWAVGLADGREEVYDVDEDGKQIGRVTWCTAAYENNRFPMYAGNLHMYYFIKNQGYDITDKFRRVCISLTKDSSGRSKEEEKAYSLMNNQPSQSNVKIQFGGGATVNADNNKQGVDSIEAIENVVNNSEILNLIKRHASTKKATSIEEMAKKITLPMIQQDELMLQDDEESLVSQISTYLKYTDSQEIIEYIIDRYLDKEVYLDSLEDKGPLPCCVIERDDIEELDKKTNVINRLVSHYENRRELGQVFSAIIFVATEEGQDFLFNKSLKDKMMQIAKSENARNITNAIVELVLASYYYDFLNFSDIADLINIGNIDVVDAILKTFPISEYPSHPRYNEVIKTIKTKIYPAADDYMKRKILQNHDYVFHTFENTTLKRYIKMILS